MFSKNSGALQITLEDRDISSDEMLEIVQGLQEEVRTKHSVKLMVAGGGHGCVRIVVVIDTSDPGKATTILKRVFGNASNLEKLKAKNVNISSNFSFTPAPGKSKPHLNDRLPAPGEAQDILKLL